MAVVLLSTSLVLGLGMGLTTLAVKGRSNPFGDEAGRIDSSEASQVLHDVIKTSKASEKSFRLKISDSLKNLFAIKKASSYMPQEESKKLKQQILSAANALKKRHEEELAISNITSRTELEQDKLISNKLDKVLADLQSQQNDSSEISKIQSLQQNILRSNTLPQTLETARESPDQSVIKQNTLKMDEETNRTNLRNTANKIKLGTASSTEKSKFQEIINLNNKLQSIRTKIEVIEREMKKRNTQQTPTTPPSVQIQPPSVQIQPPSVQIQPQSVQIQPQVAPSQVPIQVQVQATGVASSDGAVNSELEALSEQLKELRDKLEEQKAAAEAQLAELVAEKATTSALLNDEREQLRKQSEKVVELEKQVKNATDQKNEALAILRQKEEDIEGKNNNISMLETKIKNIQMEKDALDATRGLEGQKIEALNKKMEELNNLLIQERESKEQINSELEKVKSKLETVENNIKTSKAELVEAQSSFNKTQRELEKQLANTRISLNDLRRKYTDEVANKERVQKTLKEGEEKMKQQDENIMKLKVILDKLNKEKDELSKNRGRNSEEKNQKIATLNKKIQELNGILQEEREEKAKLSNNINKAKSELQESQKSTRKALEELDKSRADLEVLKSKDSTLESELTGLKEELRTKENELASLKTTIQQQTQTLTKLEIQFASTLKESEETIRAKESELSELKKHYEDEMMKARREVSELQKQKGDIEKELEMYNPKDLPKDMSEEYADDLRNRKLISSTTLGHFLKNVAKILDPRLVLAYAERNNFRYDINKPFSESSFDYKNICIACAHTTSVIFEFVQYLIHETSFINSPVSQLFQEGQGGAKFYDWLHPSKGGQALRGYETNAGIRSILFATNTLRKGTSSTRLEWKSLQAFTTKANPDQGPNANPYSHWTKVHNGHAEKLQETTNRPTAPFETHNMGIFGRLQPRLPKQAPIMPLSIDGRALKDLTTSEYLEPVRLPPRSEKQAIEDAVMNVARAVIQYTNSEYVNFEDIMNFASIKTGVNKAGDEKQSENDIVSKIKSGLSQIANSNQFEMAYLIRVFDSVNFDDHGDVTSAFSGNLQVTELTKLLKHIYMRTLVTNKNLLESAKQDVVEFREKMKALVTLNDRPDPTQGSGEVTQLEMDKLTSNFEAAVKLGESSRGPSSFVESLGPVSTESSV